MEGVPESVLEGSEGSERGPDAFETCMQSLTVEEITSTDLRFRVPAPRLGEAVMVRRYVLPTGVLVSLFQYLLLEEMKAWFRTNYSPEELKPFLAGVTAKYRDLLSQKRGPLHPKEAKGKKVS